jgi:hypothetical protein
MSRRSGVDVREASRPAAALAVAPVLVDVTGRVWLYAEGRGL